jgi:uncharacterized protein (DUF1778 family)
MRRTAQKPSGRESSDYQIGGAQAAECTIPGRSKLRLNAKASKALVDVILNPPEPGRVLREAAREYKSRPR